MYIIYQTLFQDVTKRPYPSAGARYPLEIYVVNNNIKDIKKGIHYARAGKNTILKIHTGSVQEKRKPSLLSVAMPLNPG